MRLYFESIAVVGAQPKPSVPTHKFESNKKGENGGTPTRKLDNFSRLPRRSPSVVFDQARFKAYTKKGVFGCFLRIHSLVSYPKRSSTALICLSGFKAITENIFTECPGGWECVDTLDIVENIFSEYPGGWGWKIEVDAIVENIFLEYPGGWG